MARFVIFGLVWFGMVWFGLDLYDLVCGYCLDILPWKIAIIVIFDLVLYGLVCGYCQNEFLVKIWSLYVEKWLSYGHYSDIWFGLVLYGLVWFGLVWFCMVWCVGIVKTNFWWKFKFSMLKNDWVMALCPNVASMSDHLSESVSGEPRYRAAMAAKNSKIYHTKMVYFPDWPLL